MGLCQIVHGMTLQGAVQVADQPAHQQKVSCCRQGRCLCCLSVVSSCQESKCTPAGHDNPIMLELAVFGSLISYIYSAPPLKLKQSGWVGNYALGSSYIALPWWAGQVGLRGLCQL